MVRGFKYVRGVALNLSISRTGYLKLLKKTDIFTLKKVIKTDVKICYHFQSINSPAVWRHPDDYNSE